MRLALPQAGLLLLKASPDALDKDLKPSTRTRAYCLANFIFTIGFRFFQAKIIHRENYSPLMGQTEPDRILNPRCKSEVDR